MPPANQLNEDVNMGVDMSDVQSGIKGHSTVIVFDWDDTLLSSSFLSERGYRLDTPMPTSGELVDALAALGQSVVTVLQQALQHADRVIIITNAETGWVEMSAAKFLPAVYPLLELVTVMSARSTFERLLPASPLYWKVYAFEKHLAPILEQTCVAKNIISFGDSHVERRALRSVALGRDNTRTKSVKFAERPSLDQLRREIELVNNCFEYILTHADDLDLQLTVTVHDNNDAPNANVVADQAAASTPMSMQQQPQQQDQSAFDVDDDNMLTDACAQDDEDSSSVDQEIASSTTPCKSTAGEGGVDSAADRLRAAQFVTPTQDHVVDYGSASSSMMYTKSSTTTVVSGDSVSSSTTTTSASAESVSVYC